MILSSRPHAKHLEKFVAEEFHKRYVDASVEYTTIELSTLSNINVILGDYNSGKTRLLEAIEENTTKETQCKFIPPKKKSLLEQKVLEFIHKYFGKVFIGLKFIDSCRSIELKKWTGAVTTKSFCNNCSYGMGDALNRALDIFITLWEARSGIAIIDWVELFFGRNACPNLLLEDLLKIIIEFNKVRDVQIFLSTQDYNVINTFFNNNMLRDNLVTFHVLKIKDDGDILIKSYDGAAYYKHVHGDDSRIEVIS